MTKKIPLTYTFDKNAKTITCADFSSIEFIGIITNLTSGIDIYNFLDPSKGGSLSGKVLTLEYDTSAMSNTDKLQIIIHPDALTENGALAVGNAKQKFRDGFVTGFDASIWDEVWTNQGSGVRFIGGNAAGSSYLCVSMPPENADAQYVLTSKQTFKLPNRFGYGLSLSQRVVGQEVEMSLVGCDDTGAVESNSTVPPLTISGTITIATNVATVNFATAHGLRGGDRVVLAGNTENRLNVGPVSVTVVSPTQITVPCTLANGTYTAGGTVVWADIFSYIKNAVGLVYETGTATNATWAVRRNGSSHNGSNQTIVTTIATQANTSAYTDAFRAAGDMDVIATMEHMKMVSRPASAQSAATGSAKITESIPDEGKLYKLRVRVRNLPNYVNLGADISVIAKTGTTTATVTTVTPHGLTAGQFVQIYGVLDITNFPNLTASTAVASVIDANNFTIIMGGAVTASSVGGVVVVNHGSVLFPGALNFSVQSIQATGNVLTITANTTVSGFLVGETLHMVGMSAATSYEGAYRVQRLNGATLEVTKVDGATIADIGSTPTGGALIRRTDVRLHYMRAMEYTRHLVEISNNRGTSDFSEHLPVILGNTSVAVTQSTGINTAQWSAAGWGGLLVNDIASAALTTTTTSAAISPGALVNVGVYNHSFNIAVTVVSGTSPTLDLSVEESPDSGTNWKRIYDFPRIVATGSYSSPAIRAQWGTRYRYVRTVNGTTPSFTNAVNRIQFSHNAPYLRNFIDRSIVLTTLNSVTPTYDVEGSDTIQLNVTVGAITTTAPQVQLEGSEDGIVWYAIGSPVTAVASSSVVVVNSNVYTRFARGRISTAGVGVTANFINIRAMGK